MGDKSAQEQESLLRKAAISVREMRLKLEAMERQREEPIAVVGMGCRFPGGADNPAAYWEKLQQGADLIGDVPKKRWDVDRYYDPDPDAPGRMYCNQGGFIKGEIDGFDAAFFGISPREALSLDPQQRLLLEVAWEALEHAGQSPDQIAGSLTGVFTGISTTGYGQNTVFSGVDERMDAYCGTGACTNVAAGRLSYILGLHGPCMPVDTACSSSLVATHLAMQSLRNDECEIALAGGVNLLIEPELFVYFSKLKALSPTNRCKTFDAAADGYVRGEGCGLIVLKRLSKAQQDGDNILALLRGSAVNHDGRSGGLTVPNGGSQVSLIRKVLDRAKVSPEEVGYIEAHGTGTPLGDPIEMHALVEVFGKGRSADNPLTIGSAKTNIGHLEAAAGVAGLMKIILSMQHGQIPPHLHFDNLNPHISLGDAPVQIPLNPVSWPKSDKVRMAGVSSFGINGTNAHILVEEAPKAEQPANSGQEPTGHLLTLAAKTDQALQAMATQWQHYLANSQVGRIRDLAATSNLGRSHFNHRLAIVAKGQADFSTGLADYLAGREQPNIFTGAASAEKPTIAFLFTGQGSQYVGMGRELYASQPVFRQALDQCDELLQPYLERSILSVIYPEAEAAEALLNQTAYTQPALFAIEYSLATLWRSWGVEPDLVLGHSVGEFVAACIAGVVSLQDGLHLIAERARLMQALPAGGGMAAIMATQQQVEQAIAKQGDATLSIAAVNGRQAIVVSGAEEAVQQLCDAMQKDQVQTQQLVVSHAFHSFLLEPMLDALQATAAKMDYADPRIRFVSNLTGRLAKPGEINAEYWRKHARQPVLFVQGMRTAAASGCNLFIEIGPHPTLCAMGQRVNTDPNAVWLPSLRRGKDDWSQMLESLANLYAKNLDINWSGFHQPYVFKRMPLPTYPFQRDTYWLGRPSKSVVVGAGQAEGQSPEPIHPLLHRQIHTAGQETVFQTALQANLPAWLTDHRIQGQTVFPATGYWAMAQAAAASIHPDKNVQLVNVSLEGPMIFAEDETKKVQTVLQPVAAGQLSFGIFSWIDDATSPAQGTWKRHVGGYVELVDGLAATESGSLDELRAVCAEEVSADEHYRLMTHIGLEYGPAFQGVKQLWRGNGESLARIELAPEQAQEADQYAMHPALVDACLQVLGANMIDTLDASDHQSIYMPIALGKLELFAPLDKAVWVHSKLEQRPDRQAGTESGDLRLLDDQGQTLAYIHKVYTKRTSRQAMMQKAKVSRNHAWLYQVKWQPLDALPTVSWQGGQWLILADAQGSGQALADRLRAAGESVILVKSGQAYQAHGADSFAINPLVAADYKQLFVGLGRTIDAGRLNIVHLWSLDSQASIQQPLAALESDQQRECASLLHLLQELVSLPALKPKLWLVTRGAQAVESGSELQNPSQALTWGFGRVLINEHADWQCVITDLDPAAGQDPVDGLLAELGAGTAENQIAYRNGKRYALRLLGHQKSMAMAGLLKLPEDKPYQLQIPERGVLDNLSLVEVDGLSPAPGQVKIAVRATGLNFRDVLNALDMYPGDPGHLGGECAGEIVALGEGVTGFEVGQPVVAIAPGCFSAEVVVSADLVAIIPANVSYQDAVTMPITFTTAHYSLNHIGKLAAGEKVLVHAGAGGVGQAAIQLALKAGAEVFATAGSEEKRQFLRDCGVHHVMDSRTLDFADEIDKITVGKGIDIVLNSLAGEFVTKGLSLLAPGGRFIEIGKIDVRDEAYLNENFPNIVYDTIALDTLSSEQPRFVGQMLRDLLAEFESGVLKPLPWREFPMQEAIEAFRFMQRAQHIGKVVVTRLEHGQAVSPEASYLITGGTGGLGLMVAKHLAQQGAGSVVLMGRRELPETIKPKVAEIQQLGSQVDYIQGDISRPDDAAKALARIQASGLPLRGIVHAAGVLDDGVLALQDMARFGRVLAPKVAGAWNLHLLTQGMPLDFCVYYSSVSSVIGTAGQGNYAAANSFLDALAHHRQAQGLRTLSLNWGPWAGDGMAANSAEAQKSFNSVGIELIEAEEGMAVLDEFMHRGPAQLVPFHIEWQKMLGQLPPGVDLPLLRELVTASPEPAKAASGPSSVDEFLAQLKQTPADNRFPLVCDLVKIQVVRVLGLGESAQIDMQQPLHDLGLDSLMAVELCNALGKTVGQTLPATLVFDYPTTLALAKYLAQDILNLSTEADSQADSQQKEWAETQDLSEEELEKLLLDELDGA